MIMLNMKYIYNILLQKIKQIIKVNIICFFSLLKKYKKIKDKNKINHWIDVTQLLTGNNLETIAWLKGSCEQNKYL